MLGWDHDVCRCLLRVNLTIGILLFKDHLRWIHVLHSSVYMFQPEELHLITLEFYIVRMGALADGDTLCTAPVFGVNG